MTLDESKRYFETRLQEIDQLNTSGTLSAYSCYAWLIGVLSHVAFVAQKPTKANEDYSRDEDCFVAFVRTYMSIYNAELLYKNFRCGLIHACSFDDKWSGDDNAIEPSGATRFLLTHKDEYRRNKGLKELKMSGRNTYVIHYKDLSDDIRLAIESMYKDDKAKESIEKAIRHQRLIESLKGPNDIVARKFRNADMSTAFAQLSGFCND